MTMPAGERRVVAVLVADVADSTGIAEKLGPERSKFLFDEVVALMRAEVERFGGVLAQLSNGSGWASRPRQCLCCTTTGCCGDVPG